jgi:hypothetical protein
VLGINRKTVVRKFLFLAECAQARHEEWLEKTLPTLTHTQFDEMESFEHTRLKPLSIPLLVNGENGNILNLEVASLGYKGRFAALALKKYGPREDHSEKAALRVLETLNKCPNPIEIRTDLKTSYPRLITEAVADKATHVPVKADRLSLAQRLFHKGRRNGNDPLFMLNFTAAKIRHDLSRMARKVWTTTKKMDRLYAHLFLFIAYHNGYNLFKALGK